MWKMFVFDMYPHILLLKNIFNDFFFLTKLRSKGY